MNNTDRLKKLEEKVRELDKRLAELKRQIHSHQHLPNIPLRVVGKPLPAEGIPIIPEVVE